MAFDNIYPNRKDWRKQYRDSRAFDRYCRSNSGMCDWCSGNRTHKNRRRAPIVFMEEIMPVKHLSG